MRYPALLPELKRRIISSKLVPAVEAVCSTACSAVQLSADEVQLHISRPRFWETEDKQDTFVEVLAYGPVDMASALADMLTAEGTLPLPAPYSAPGFLGAAMLTVGLNGRPAHAQLQGHACLRYQCLSQQRWAAPLPGRRRLPHSTLLPSAQRRQHSQHG